MTLHGAEWGSAEFLGLKMLLLASAGSIPIEMRLENSDSQRQRGPTRTETFGPKGHALLRLRGLILAV
jgi:hypothetical protein